MSGRRKWWMGAAGVGLVAALAGSCLEFGRDATAADAPATAEQRVVVAEARRQAETLHSAMNATLQLVHQRYYREDEGLPIPAAIVKQVFRDVKAERGVELRWLVVDGQAMNSDHQAKDDFERAAAKALAAGKEFHEQIADGTYRRAAPIPLSNVCLKCHLPDRKSTVERRAGLIVSMPVATP